MQTEIGELRERVRGIATETDVAMIGVQGLNDRPGIAARIFGPLAGSDLSVDVIVQNAGLDGFLNIGFTVARKDLARAREVAEDAARELGAREWSATTGWPRSASSVRACRTSRGTLAGCSGHWPTPASTSRWCPPPKSG